jgi:hypothetical protein
MSFSLKVKRDVLANVTVHSCCEYADDAGLSTLSCQIGGLCFGFYEDFCLMGCDIL